MRKGGSSGSTFLKRKILLEIRSMSIETADISYQIRCLLEIERFGHIFFVAKIFYFLGINSSFSFTWYKYCCIYYVTYLL